MRPRSGVLVEWLLPSILPCLLAMTGQVAGAGTLAVPAQYASVQTAVNAALDGDTVLVAPGVYAENLSLLGKGITLASHFHTTGDRGYIGQTIIDGGGGAWVIRIIASAGPHPTIVGLTLRNGDDGVKANAKFDFLDNRVTDTRDGIDYESGSGGVIRGCAFEGNTDDGIDLDDDVETIIENNTIQNNHDDGIEIRLQGHTSPKLSVVIRDNVIADNGEDGIQLISYDVLTSRKFRIERNLIANNAMAGIGTMCCQNTTENYQGADMRERVELYNNTIVGNDHGVIGGDSLIALNNIIANTTNTALKRADAGSMAAYNLFFANGTDYLQSNVDGTTTVTADPLLGADYRPGSGSPAIDAGTSSFTWNGEVVWTTGVYSGAAPDLGAIEALEPVSVPGVELPSGAILLPPAPNPGRGSTALRVDVAAPGRIRVEIVDVTGRRVRPLADFVATAGRHDLSWDGRDGSGRAVLPGVYGARLVNAGMVQYRRFVKLR